MGKSLKNAVSPEQIYEEYGADTLRLYEMAMGPLDASRPWEARDVVGMYRFLQRVWRNLVDEATGRIRRTCPSSDDGRAAGAPHVDGVRSDMEGSASTRRSRS
jgi:leucyl-tRNA synthetase